MGVLDKAESHFKDKLSAPLKHVDVPEWGENGEPFRIYYRPTSTLDRKDRVIRAAKEGGISYLADILLEYALDEDGRRIFRRADKDRLLGKGTHTGVDPDVITRIAGALSECFDVTDVDAAMGE